MEKRETLEKCAAPVLKELKINTASFSQNPLNAMADHVPTK
jgi:hypothetical protein